MTHGKASAVRPRLFLKHQSQADMGNTALVIEKNWEQNDCITTSSGNSTPPPRKKCSHLEAKTEKKYCLYYKGRKKLPSAFVYPFCAYQEENTATTSRETIKW